jgi:uncharacterized protein (DUF1800 family)
MAPRVDLLRNPEAAWSPWRPTASDPWDVAQAAHLHRRAGLGATWGQVQRDAVTGFEPSVRRILEGDTHGPDGRPADEFAEIVDAMIASARREPSIERVLYLWLFRLIFTPHALAERMTLAWHGHYATSFEKVRSPLLMLDQNLSQLELWRSRISQLHWRMLRDPAMLAWLDGLNSRKAQLNENLAREFLEVFALGEGNYTEDDIHAVARALTGWQGESYDPSRIRFDAEEHDQGEKTLLGQSGRWGVEDVVRIACAQPAAAIHVARRLFRTLVADTLEPPTILLESLARTMRGDHDMDVARGIEVILHSRLFFSAWCRGHRVKSPVEFVVGAIRACERFDPPPDFVELDGWLTRMGQRLFYPPNVAGWPDGLPWLRGPTLLARAGFAASGIVTDEAALARVARRHGLTRHDAWADALATLILGPPTPRKGRGGQSFSTIVRDLIASPEAQLG